MLQIDIIKNAIQAGESDAVLNQKIEEALAAAGINKTAQQWRIENYITLRRWAYPTMEDYNDAMVKKYAGGSLTLEGEDQLIDYVQKCLAVKSRFPKF